jgi:hypothetical protein
VAGELRADVPHPVTQADHIVEALAGEQAQVFGGSARDVDAVSAHRHHGAGMQRLGMAAGAVGLDHSAALVLGEGLGHL